VERRFSESTERPKAIVALKTQLNYSRIITENITQYLNVTEEEAAILAIKIEDIESWLHPLEVLQLTRKSYEDPVVTSQQIYAKSKLLEKEVKRLLSRPLKPKPKPPVVANNSTDNTETDYNHEQQDIKDEAIKDEQNTYQDA